MELTTIKIIRQSSILPSHWTGGTTTQLVIFPENSSYLDQNFAFRLSTATIETETSRFTQLHGVRRSLMVLQGSMKLEHKGHYSKEMKKFDRDTFCGDWETTSYGKVIDFNLMTRGSTNGFLESNCMDINTTIEEKIDKKYHSLMYYVLQGKIAIDCQEEKYMLENNELCWIQMGAKMPEIRLEAMDYTEMIKVFIL